MSKVASKPPETGRGKDGFPYRCQREHGSTNTLTSDSSFQNFGKINACCFKPPCLWCFVLKSWETNTGHRAWKCFSVQSYLFTDFHFYPRTPTQTTAVNTLDCPLTSKWVWLMGNSDGRLEREKTEVRVFVDQVPSL